jgi:putative ABC transport system permease protein
MLSTLGAGAGLLLAMWGTELLARLSRAKMLQMQPIETDLRVLGFTLLISLTTGLLFGLAPAWQTARQDINLGLKEGSKGSAGSVRRRLREMLVVVEVALALVLLIGAGLLIRSFTRVLDVSPGFESANLLTFPIRAVGAKLSEEAQVRALTTELVKRVEALPGVEAAAFVGNLPLSGNYDTSGFHIEERPLPNPADAPDAERYGVTTGYFRAMGIPLLRGRGFTEQDSAGAPLVTLINETAARRLWPNEDPLGKRIRLGGITSPLRTIVGVVGDVSHYGLEKPVDLQAYLPHAQWTNSFLQLMVRTQTDPAALVGPVRQAIRAQDPDQPADSFKTMRELISDSVAERRFTLILIAGFAAIALLMASIGIYGVVAYLVSQRTQEIGIRMALGAGRRDVLAMILKQGMRWAAIGLAIGLIAAFGLSRLLSGFLFGITPTDPLTFFVIALLLTMVALLACWIPARRAAKVDPMVALRQE